MKVSALLLAAGLLTVAGAQTTTPFPGSTTSGVRPRTASPAPAKARPGKAVLPDPDLLDGSKYEAEKRPPYGMLSEIEMGEEEGGDQDRVSPNSGPKSEAATEAPKPGAGGAEQEKSGSAEKIEEGPAAEAVGAQAQKLTVPEGAPAGGPQNGGAREMQIGDATLQIQTEAKSPDVVGQEASKSQQYEKPVPAGQQSNSRNKGVEKGKVIPQGL